MKGIDFFIKESSKFLKKSGVMFIATLNKTLKSYLFAIVGAEYVLKWLPIGTHDWEKFIKPNDLIKPLHHRMPVVVPNGYEKQWTEKVKDLDELKSLFPIKMGWKSKGWVLEEINKKRTDQMSLF